MKRFFFTLFLIAGVTLAYANTSNTGLSYDGQWLSAFDSIVINEDSLQFVTITMEDENKRNSFDHWSISGDLKVNPDYSPNATSIQISSHGAGKGRLAYIYNQVGCGSMSVSIDIYKRFNPNVSPYNIEISGPDCILEGDTVVYSIKPILTKNLTQGIGVDEYFWSFSSGLVNKKIYNAGDGSSVTFVAGAVDDNSSLSVQVGLANASYPVTKTLGKSAPTITFTDTCIAVSSRVVLFRVPNPQENLFYKWLIPSPQFSALSSTIGDSIRVKLNDNSNGEITVLSSYDKNNWDGCSVSTSSFMVNRMIGSGNRVQSDKVCYSVGDTAQFKITGTLPDNTSFEWQFPEGWNVVLDDGQSEEEVLILDSIKLVATENITDSVFNATMKGCSDMVTPDYHVYVRPAGVGEIIGERCVSRDDSVWYHVNPFAHKPYAHHFEWLLPEGMEELRSTPMKDSIYVHVKTTGELGTITAIPQGNNSVCEGPASSMQVFLEAQIPSGISIKHCIASGMNDIDTFSVISPREGQSYRWILPLGIDSLGVSDNDTAIYVSTNGVPGKYPVKVQEIGGVECGDSQLFVDTFTIDTAHIDITIFSSVSFNLFTCVTKNALISVTDYKWYVDGEPNTDAEGHNVCFIYRPDYDSVYVEAIVNGCKQRITKYSNSSPQTPVRKNIIKDFNKLMIKPNPAQTISSVTLPERIDNSKITLYNAEGKVIKEWITNEQELQIQTSDLPDGIYPIVAVQNDVISSNMLIIKH